MPLNVANFLTLFRIVLIPVLVLFFYLPIHYSNLICTIIFVVAALTDWADGFIARRFNQSSSFGAFLDPVADKLMISTTLVLLIEANPELWVSIPSAIIIGREITMSALREWMANIGEGARLKVAMIGKIKTTLQMVALPFLLYENDLLELPILLLGKWLLSIAAALTLISMFIYIQSVKIVIKKQH